MRAERTPSKASLTENRRERAAEARQDVLTEQLAGLVEHVLRSVRTVDSREAAFRIDRLRQTPRPQRSGRCAG
jgi:hypothetical protein